MGRRPHAAAPDLPPAQAAAIAEWILAQANDPAVHYSIGKSGSFQMSAPSEPGPQAALVLSAFYTGPLNPGENPFSVSLTGESIDLYDSKYCLPPTTCDAYLDAVNVTLCGPGVSCGAAGITDGICTDVGATNDQCTYSCDTSYECPDRLPVCDSIGGFCRLE